MKIVDIKTKIIPSNPRSKNYPIGYPGGIASNSNGVTPDLSIYLLKEIWERNFEERTDEYGNEYLYIRKPLAIGGGATMYASNGVVVPSIFDGLPLDNTTIRKNPETGLIEVIGGTGTSFDENAMWSALSGSSDNQINKSHLTMALEGYATRNWVIENYATKSELSAVSNKLSDFLEGSDTDMIINKWKELEAFLSGMAETDNLAEILETKADKKYVDSTFVTIATEQDITAIKHFKKGLTIGEANKMIYEENGVIYIDANVAVTGAVTMYATGTQNVASIYDGLPIDGNTIYWEEVEGSRVLKAKEGSGSSFDKNAMWTALAGGTTEQINKSHLTTALNGYATESWVTSKNYLTSVSIATISDLHANWDALLKAAPSSYVTRWPTISEVTDRKNLIIKLNGGSTEGTNLFTYNVTGEKTINITPAGIGAAASSHNHSWSNITSGKPSTLSGYGITDAYTKTESDSKYPTKTGSGASGTWGINVTGNAGTATKLQTARSLWGNNFDGTANISGDITLAIGKGIYLSANDERWLLQTKRSDNTQINGIKTNGFQMCTYFGDTKTMQFSNDRIYSYVDFRAEKDLYINGIRLHKTADGVITLEGNLAVTGGVTMYAIDPVSVSTVMDGVVVDGTTIKKENGKLVAVGGGEAGSVAWGNISGKPSVFATNIANITDLHSSWDAVLKAQKPNWLTAVSIATISDLHANWDALLKAAPSAYVTRWPTISEVTGKQNLIVKLNGGTTEGTNQFTYNATGAKTINITPAGIGAAASSHNHSWSNITSGKPSTLSGYGITDAYTKTESDSKYPTKTGSGASGTWGINVTGNAGTATKLQTARSLWGNNFDGTANISGDITLAIGKGIYLSANDERWLLQTKRSDNTQINGIKTNGFQMCTYFGDTKTMQFSNDRIYSYVDFRAEKDLYINGIRLHKTADGVITLEGNLAVTGGVTMYAIDPVSVSTVMDGVVVDGTTIKKENGKLVAVGGGEAGSVAWGNISGKPSVFATNIANITDLHSSWDAVLKAQKPNWLTAVSIATISDLHANWDALLKAAPSAYVTRWPTISEVTGKQNLIVKLNGGTTEGTNQFTYNATGAKTINITPAGIGAAASSHNHSWSNITSGKPTTLAGYGITDAPTKTGGGASGTWAINITGTAGAAHSADSAVKLQNVRKLWGNNFDGTTDVTGQINASNGIKLPYRGSIVTQFGNLLRTDYSEGDYNDFFELTARGSGSSENKLLGGNSGLLTWSGNRFIFNAYGVGWYAEDGEWMRTYNSLYVPKNVQCKGNIECDNKVICSTLQAKELDIAYGTNYKFVRMSWNGTSGDVASFFVPGSTSQWFTMELRSNGVLYTNGNILAEGGGTYYGSDIRYKSIMQQVELSLLSIANAPSFVYRWNKKGMKRDRLNLGGSAQYTQSILPWAVEDNSNFLMMDYATVAYTFAVHTARHLLTYESRTDKKIKKLENRVKYLEKQLKKLGYEEVRTLDDQSV